MRDLTQIIRDAISGMFTANVTEEVVKRIVQAIEGDEGSDIDDNIRYKDGASCGERRS